VDVLPADLGPLDVAGGHLAGDTPADGGDFPLQVPHPRLPGVAPDNDPECSFGEGDLAWLQAVLPDLPGEEIALGDVELFLHRVAHQLDDLQAVPQGRRDRVEDVGGGDEHHVGKIEGKIQIMVHEGEILGRVQDLQEGRGGIAAKIAAQFVDFVEHEHRIIGFRPADALDDPAGQSADVSAAVPPDLRLVPDAAQGDADELSAQGAGDGLPQRGFARSRGTYETEDRSLRVRFQLPDGQVFDDALLGLFQAVVIIVEDLAGLFDVQVVLRALPPGQGEDPVQIGGNDVIFRRGWMHPPQTLQLPLRLFPGLLGEVLAGQLFPVFLHLHLGFVLFAQFLLYGGQLLAQVIIALALVHIILHLGLDLIAQLEDFHLVVDEAGDLTEALLGGRSLQDALLFLRRDVDDGGDQVRQNAGIGNGLGHGAEFLGEKRSQFDDPLEEAHQIRHEGLDFYILAFLFLDRFNPGLEIGLAGDEFPDPKPLYPLDEELGLLLRRFGHLQDNGAGPDSVKIFRIVGRLRRAFSG